MVLFSILKLSEAEEETNSGIPTLLEMKTEKICKALLGSGADLSRVSLSTTTEHISRHIVFLA